MALECAPTQALLTTMFQALGQAEINIHMITTSEIKISVVVDETNLDKVSRQFTKPLNWINYPNPRNKFLLNKMQILFAESHFIVYYCTP